MKRGQIYFSWIFVVVVGAILLTFFIGFAVKYKDLQEKKTEIVMLNNLDTALTNLQSSSFVTSTNINLPLDINIDCDELGYSLLINEKNRVDYLLASKSKLKNKMYIWYQPYDIPFKVTNFYYLVDNSKVKINANFYEEIIRDMPESFRNKVINDSTGINIQGDINEGVVNGVKYIGKEMLYAAIFSQDYQCFYNNFKEKLDETILVYQNKAAVLSRSGCNYNLILSKLDMLKDFDNVHYNIIESIDGLNRNLISINCPSLF